MNRNGREGSNYWKAGVLGAVSGLAGVAAMDFVMARTSKLVEKLDANGNSSAPSAGRARPWEDLDDHSMSAVGRQYRDGESATAATGRILMEAATGGEPRTKETARLLSTAVHWAYGTEMGAVYGLARARPRGTGAAAGLTWGAALWLGGDEVAVPLLGLSKSPHAVPLKTHALALGAHLGYGLAVGVTYRALQRLTSRAEVGPEDDGGNMPSKRSSKMNANTSKSRRG